MSTPSPTHPSPSSGLPSFPGLSRIAPLESGAMGSVFRAWQDELSRPVAVKTLRAGKEGDADLRARFVREAHILARLDHPGIVPVYAAGETDRGPYYVMRLVDGVSVDRFLAGAQGLQVARVFLSIATALDLAHREGVLHRDLKPANILVEADGRAVLVDFGLATRLGAARAGNGDRELAGTPDFLAPELFAGEPASIASDVYALGATLYCALTGRVPFPADDLAAKLRAIREDDPPPPRALRSAVPKALQAICLKAMERRPEDRYASAAELARDLERFASGDVVLAFPVRSRSLLRRKIERHLADHAEWAEQGLLDEPQRNALLHAYQRLDELQRGLLRGVSGSLPNLMLLLGILLSVFGPTLLGLVTWDTQDSVLRIGLPSAPLALLTGLGLRRWRREDRRRAVACLAGAAMLIAPVAFALADLVPALRTVNDDAGTAHSVLPGTLWLPSDDSPAWMLAGARLLEWKVLITAIATLAGAAFLYRRTRAAVFLWIACLAGLGISACGALVAGWRELAVASRWALAILGSLAALGIGVRFDRGFRRDRAQPFYGLAFAGLFLLTLAYAEDNLPLEFLGVAKQPFGMGWSVVCHGLAFVGGGLVAHARGTALLRQVAGAPLFTGLLLTLGALTSLTMSHTLLHEFLLVGACIGFLVLGLAVHRHSLVLPAAILLPIAVGTVSQRHVQAVWAWSIAVVIGSAILVLVSFRVGARGERSAT
ncbi:MAG: serine/threonine protein kinase [Planctomycetes bacterium]|nr:serine/threonine protein kinase [Planctomycetota bacterium]